MAERLGEAVLHLSTNATQLTRGLNRARMQVGRTMGDMSRRMSQIGMSMSAGLLLPLGIAAREGVAELKDMEAANRQTAATIARVGKTAGVTSRDVGAYARKLHQLTGMDDQAIQTGENLILTLGNISNKTKEGKKHFAAATQAAVDMAAATGKDMPAASMLLARALGNPEKGLMALGRAGVRITDQQKEQIKTWMANGEAAKAQGFIIDAVGKKFKGAGKAMGQTTEAKVNRLKEAFAGASASLLTTMLPTLEKLMGHVEKAFQWFETLSPSIKKFVGIGLAVAVAMGPVASIIGGIAAGIELLIAVVGAVASPIGLMVAAVGAMVVVWARSEKGQKQLARGLEVLRRVGKKALSWLVNVGWPKFQAAASKAGDWIANVVVPQVASVLGELGKTISTWAAWAQTFWKRHGEQIVAAAKATWGVVGPYITRLLKLVASNVKIVLALLRGDWSKAWTQMKTTLKILWDQMKAYVSVAMTVLKNTVARALSWLVAKAKEAGPKIVSGVTSALRGLPGLVLSIFTKVISTTFWGFVTMAAKATAGAVRVVNATKRALHALPGVVWGILKQIPGKATAMAHALASQMSSAGTRGVGSLRAALAAAPGAVWNAIKNIPATIGRIKTEASSMASSIGTAIVSALKKAMKDAVPALLSQVKSIVSRIKKKFKDELKQNSPSRVMMDQVGKPITEGIAAGMIAGTHHIDRAAVQIAKRVKDAARSINLNTAKDVKLTEPGMIKGSVGGLRALWEQAQANKRKAEAARLALIMQPVEKLGILMDFARAKLSVATAKLGAPTVNILTQMANLARDEAAKLEKFLATTKGLTTEQKTEVLTKIADLLTQQREYVQQIKDLTTMTPPDTVGPTTGTTTTTPTMGTTTASFAYGDALLGGARFGGNSRPVVGNMNVTVTDATVDVPRFMRRLDWHSRIVGAY